MQIYRVKEYMHVYKSKVINKDGINESFNRIKTFIYET